MVEEVNQRSKEVCAGHRGVERRQEFPYTYRALELEAPSPDAGHVCTNETIGGIEYQWTPDVGAVPLVADMSSHLLSRPLDVSKYGVIYAAQKNMAPPA